MALSVCLDCSTVFAVGLSRCPYCRSTDYAEQGQPMPKITRQGGASHEVPAGASSPEIVGDGTGQAMPPIEQEGDQPSPGNSSSTSPGKPQPTETPSETGRPRRARTTASRSKQGRAANSSAGSTATDGPADI